MQITVKGRNVKVTDDLRTHVEKRFGKIGKQVSEFAELEVALSQETKTSIPDAAIADATLRLKGVTLHAHEASRDLIHSINVCADELGRQVKRHRDKRRNRREARAGRDAGGPDEVTAEGEILAG